MMAVAASVLLTGFGGLAHAASGAPAFCYASATRAGTQIAFRPYCRSIETALRRDGSFQFALDNIRRVHAELVLTALPDGEIAAAILVKPSGDALIDRSLMNSLRTVHFAPGADRAETFGVIVALQPVENMPSVVYRVGD